MAYDVVEMWKELHEIPELGFEEKKTSAYAAEKMRSLGFEVQENFADTTAVVCYKRTGNPGPTVLLRCDMDALPFKNEDGTTVAVHACGHDSHVAMMIATAQELVNKVTKGTLKILFQPAEETLLGAVSVIKGGLLDDVDIAFGMHIRPIQDMPAGNVCASVNYTSSVFCRIDVKGRTAHASRPHLGVNCAEVASAITQAIGSMKLNPTQTWSCKVTQINASAASPNIIPDSATLWVDARAQTNELMDEMQTKLKLIVENTAAAFGATGEVVLPRPILPAPMFTEELIAEAEEEIVRLFGKDKLSKPCNGGGEDFTYFTKVKPTLKNAYFGIGVGAAPGLHNRDLHFDPKHLVNGVKLMSAMALKKLS